MPLNGNIEWRVTHDEVDGRSHRPSDARWRQQRRVFPLLCFSFIWFYYLCGCGCVSQCVSVCVCVCVSEWLCVLCSVNWGFWQLIFFICNGPLKKRLLASTLTHRTKPPPRQLSTSITIHFIFQSGQQWPFSSQMAASPLKPSSTINFTIHFLIDSVKLIIIPTAFNQWAAAIIRPVNKWQSKPSVSNIKVLDSYQMSITRRIGCWMLIHHKSTGSDWITLKQSILTALRLNRTNCTDSKWNQVD